MKHPFDRLHQQVTTQKRSNLSLLAQKCKNKTFHDFWNDILVKPEGIHGPSKLYPFQENLISDLQNYRRVAVLAARNMGKSEIALRYGLWLTLCKQISGNYIFISGVGYTLARSLCRRAKSMLSALDVHSDDNSTTLTFPSLNARWSFYGSDSRGWRGQNQVKYLVADEVAHFDDSQDWRASIDTFAVKDSGTTIFIITTPSSHIDSIAHRLFKEDDNNSLYKHVYLNYKQGVGMMYRPEDIELLKKTSESFPVEYDLRWGYSYEGSVFHEKDIQRAIQMGNLYSPETDYNPSCVTSMALDFGFGSSPSGICISQLNKGVVQILYCNEIERPSLEDILQLSVNLMQKYNPDKVYLDGSSTELTDELKRLANMNLGWREEIPFRTLKERCEKTGLNYEEQCRIVPIPFNKLGKSMLVFSKMALEKGLIAINEKSSPKLIASLRSAKEKDGLLLKGGVTRFDNAYDAYRMSLRIFTF